MMTDKILLINDIKQKVVDIFEFYDSSQLRIEINCNSQTKQVKINITEINL
jgi:hypothetical protein